MKFPSRHLLDCAASIALTNVIVMLPNQSAYAQYKNPCPDYPPIPASQNDRLVQLRKFNIEFKIPANYKTVSSGNNDEIHVGIYNPSSFRTVTCMVQNKIGAEDFYVLVHIHVKTLDKKEDLVSINQKIHTRGGTWNIRNVTVNGQKAIRYRHSHLSSENIGFSFLKSDGKTLVNISYTPSTKSSIVDTEKLAAQIVDSIR